MHIAQFEDAVTDLCVTSHYLKLHWSIVPCEWDSDFQVGDTIDLSFQVGIIIIIIIIVIIVTIIIITRPWPAFGRLGLGGSSGGYSSHGLTSNASLRTCGTQLGVKSTCQ